MQDNIQQILEENFAYENGSLDFSCTKIELTLQPGVYFEGSFQIQVHGGGHTVGQVTSSDIRMECFTREFAGSGEEIAYCFHGSICRRETG
ncbi:MAG: hypothetical protein J6B43_08040 [Lachnospiraceae bacterium]|nr:hypothetical protein [Lachnospiraceae bacterium]